MANPVLILMELSSEGLSSKVVQKVEDIMHRLRCALPFHPAGGEGSGAGNVGCRQHLRHSFGTVRYQGRR
jgi:hypothetical protein